MTTSETVPIVRASPAQIGPLAAVLAAAFQDEADFAYMLPDPEARRRVLPWFFREIVLAAGRLYGEVYTTAAADGAAIWLAPGNTLTFRRMLRTGLLWAPFRFGWAGFRRSLDVNGAIERARARHVPGPHWYLMVLGVAPAMQGRGLGGALMQPVLLRADRDGVACYLETYNERLARFYGRHGFQVAGTGETPHGGPPFTAMIRPARQT